MKAFSSLNADSPKRTGRMESIHWYVFFVLLLVGAVFFVMELLHARAVRKQEQFFSDRQYLQTTMSRLALEDRVASVLTQKRFLLEHLLPENPNGSFPPVSEIQRTLQSAIYNTADILGFYFAPHPLHPAAQRFSSFRSTPAGDAARDFARSLEGSFDFSSPRPADLYHFSGTVRASSRARMMALVEASVSEKGFIGYFITVIDLAPFFVRYVLPMAQGPGSAVFVIDREGVVVEHGDASLAGRNAAELSGGEGDALRGAWSRVGESFSGMEAIELYDASSGAPRRKRLAWNSARVGANRLYIGVYAPESDINPVVGELRVQRYILGGVLALLLVMIAITFIRKRSDFEVRRSESTFRAIFNSAASGIAILDANGVILSCNTTLETMTGRPSAQLRMRTLFDLAAPSPPEEKEKVREALHSGAFSARAELLFSRKRNDAAGPENGSFWGDVSLNRLERDSSAVQMLAVVTDISGLKRAEDMLRQNAETLEARKKELEHVASSQSALLEMFTFFSDCVTIEELFSVLSEHLYPVIPFRCQTLFIKRSREAASFEVLDSGGDVLRSMQTDFLEKKKGVLGYVADTGKAYLMGDVSIDPYFIPHSPEVRSAVVAPVMYKGFLWGAIVLDSDRKFAFGIRERDMLSIVGSYVALHLEEFFARQELDRKATQLRFLHRVIQQIAAVRNNEALARKIVDVLFDELGFPGAGFYIPPPKGESAPVLVAGRSREERESCSPGCELEAGAAMRSRTPVERGENGRALVLSIPAMFEGEVFGALGARHEVGFSAADRELLEITAEHMTTFWALNNLLAQRRHESLVDPLTQVWNRRYIMHRLDEESSRIDRTNGSGSVILVDLGDFKQINDRYGHVTGDEVLRVTSATMSENLRNYDMIGRYGGDEFLLYLPDVSREDAGAIMERMELKVAEQKMEGFEGTVILDYGIAVCPEDGSSLSEVIKIADERMYKYKAERKAVKAE